jgi:hypothetical protein
VLDTVSLDAFVSIYVYQHGGLENVRRYLRGRNHHRLPLSVQQVVVV